MSTRETGGKWATLNKLAHLRGSQSNITEARRGLIQRRRVRGRIEYRHCCLADSTMRDERYEEFRTWLHRQVKICEPRVTSHRGQMQRSEAVVIFMRNSHLLQLSVTMRTYVCLFQLPARGDLTLTPTRIHRCNPAGDSVPP